MQSIGTKPNCIIIHGCAWDAEEEVYDKHWIPWLQKELARKGIRTDTPHLPDPWQPDYLQFKHEFERYTISPDTILIGHSCGCAFLVRWLGESKRKIRKLILVAPWKIPEEDNPSKARFYDFIPDKSIPLRVGKILMFTSDNEEAIGKKSLDIFHQALGGEVIELKSHGHYTLNDMGTEEFSELLTAALEA